MTAIQCTILRELKGKRYRHILSEGGLSHPVRRNEASTDRQREKLITLGAIVIAAVESIDRRGNER